MAEPLFIDPRDHDDTELGSRVRDAYANGTRVVLLTVIGQACPRSCDSCSSEGSLVYSAPHDAYFCERCFRREWPHAGPLAPAPDPDDLPM